MAGERRSRQLGRGMTPLFALDASARLVMSEPRPAPPRAEGLPSVSARPAPYRVRGVYLLRTGEEIARSVPGIAMSDRRDEQIRRFGGERSCR